MIAGGQVCLIGGVAGAALVLGSLVTYLCDHIHCDHCHHVEQEEPRCHTRRSS